MSAIPSQLGPYEIMFELAAGGMAVTYVGRKQGAEGFERLVVIKRVHPHLVSQPELPRMLLDEARVAGLIRHPNAVPVEDIIEAAGEMCLVMPYVESISLAALIDEARRAGERLSPGVASRVLLDALAGLHAAHEATDLRGQSLEIVHRDLSPRNVLVGSDGLGRIIDFGVARAARRMTSTKSGVLKGTLSYMAPEQLRGRELDRRADVFAAGALLYEALTGERLFDGEDEASVLLGVLADEIPSVSVAVSGVPPEVDEVLARALSREREERFASAAAFAEALEGALAPAPSRDVAQAVLRFGGAEIARRQEAIRVFVERKSEARSAEETAKREEEERSEASEDSARAKSAKSAEARPLRRGPLKRIGALFFAVMLVGVSALGVRSFAGGAASPKGPSPAASLSAALPVVALASVSAGEGRGEGREREIELRLLAARPIREVHTAGLVRVEGEGARALSLWVRPWSGTLLVEAALDGAGTAVVRFEASGAREARIEEATPRATASARVLAKPRPDLQGNPYR